VPTVLREQVEDRVGPREGPSSNVSATTSVFTSWRFSIAPIAPTTVRRPICIEDTSRPSGLDVALGQGAGSAAAGRDRKLARSSMPIAGEFCSLPSPRAAQACPRPESNQRTRFRKPLDWFPWRAALSAKSVVSGWRVHGSASESFGVRLVPDCPGRRPVDGRVR
jgi:hypothetical protein